MRRGGVEAAAAEGCRFVVAAGRVGNGAGELLVALPARHLDRGGQDERRREDGAAPGLVLFKMGGRGGGRKKGGKTYLPRILISFHLPALRVRGSCG